MAIRITALTSVEYRCRMSPKSFLARLAAVNNSGEAW